MAENKMCPHCGGLMFMATITRACVVEVTTDSNEPYKILKEGKDKFDIELLKCARCKEDITEADLVTGVKCKECGRIVGSMDVNEDGVCNVCVAVKQRAELANASKEDLIKMLLDAEKKANPIAAKMEKQIEKADNITASQPVVEEETQDTTETTTDNDKAEEKKPRRKATRKKKDDDSSNAVNDSTEVTTEEATQENVAEVTTEAETEAVDTLANQQEAPFPEINSPENVMPAPTPETPQEEEQPIGADFQMFDDGEEPF